LSYFLLGAREVWDVFHKKVTSSKEWHWQIGSCGASRKWHAWSLGLAHL